MSDTIDPMPGEPVAAELSDYEYTVMITLLRIYDAISALAEEIAPGAGSRIAAMHKDGTLIMPEPAINGKFGEGFSK